MKTCKDCGAKKRQEKFYGLQGECKECTKRRVRINYRKNINHYVEYERERQKTEKRRQQQLRYQRKRRLRYPGKNRARNVVAAAIKSGRIKKGKCEVCKDTKTEAHHTDYRRPLYIKWLCRKHHLELEGKVKRE